MKKILFLSNRTLDSVALLLLRIAFGGIMLYAHGWPKLMSFSEKANSFPDPFGVGSPISLGLAVFAEVFCAAALVLGLMTRASAFFLLVTMGVAAFIIHGSDPFSGKELALVYFFPYLALLISGPGKFSVDEYFLKK